MHQVRSADGTSIAYERAGQGAPVIVVSGILSDRQSNAAVAEHLSSHFSVINYDRRGRGASGDTAPYALEREVEDLGALIREAGGKAAVYGHSSGAGLALNAAARGLPITRLVLHEPPYGADDEQSQRGARELAEKVLAAVSRERFGDAIEVFMSALGLPPDVVTGMSQDPKLRALARTMPYDFEVMGEVTRGGTIPVDVVRSVRVQTLVIAGGASLEFFRDTASRIAKLLPNGEYKELVGADHSGPPSTVAAALTEFLSRP